MARSSPARSSSAATGGSRGGDRFERVVRRPVSDELADYVRRLILDGKLTPGSRIPQDEIAAANGVSRIPLREALIVLEREGWVRLEIHRGAFVNAIDERSLHDHFEIYALLLGFAAKAAIERAGPELADELTAIRDEFVAADDARQQRTIAIDFNRAVVRASGSLRVQVVLQAMRGFTVEDYFSRVAGAADLQRRQMTAIISAVRHRDPDKAAQAYRRLMTEAGKAVISLLEERGVLAAGGDQPSG